MNYSQHNIFSKIKDSENYFLVNVLSQNADILSPEMANQYLNLKDSTDQSEFIEKGYWIDEKQELKLYKNKYLDFVDLYADDEVQLFFVPNYLCNFSCSYCYQDDYKISKQELTTEIIDSFFEYVSQKFANRKKYITVFGGEPLINTPKQRELLEYFLQKSNLDICFVTNGYTLVEYIDILKKAHIREIQITLDGTAQIHNQRRTLKNGEGTFERVVSGIEACLENKITVNLRMVIDKENINNLPELAQFAIDKAWTKSPYFKTQIGRNYELHHCQSSPEKLFDRASLYEKIYELTLQFPHILEFYKPAYSISKFLFENGELPNPLFDSCPACKTEWAFDYTGTIYPCTAMVGKSGEELGTFYPEFTENQEFISHWENRDVTTIAQCKSCNLQLACGGGCGAVAKNKNGSISSPDCRPIKELIEIGFAAYFNE